MSQIAYAIAKYVHITQKKINPTLHLFRGNMYKDCLKILKTLPYKKRLLIWKVLYSAVSNLIYKTNISKENIQVIQTYSTKGPKLKRIHARAKGKAYKIEKKMSHITFVVKVKELN